MQIYQNALKASIINIYSKNAKHSWKCESKFELSSKQVFQIVKNRFFQKSEPHKGRVISALLSNIAFHGLQKCLDRYRYINTLGSHCPNNKQAFTYVRYANDFVIMHHDQYTLKRAKLTAQEFLKPIGFELNSTKTQIL